MKISELQRKRKGFKKLRRKIAKAILNKDLINTDSAMTIIKTCTQSINRLDKKIKVEKFKPVLIGMLKALVKSS